MRLRRPVPLQRGQLRNALPCGERDLPAPAHGAVGVGPDPAGEQVQRDGGDAGADPDGDALGVGERLGARSRCWRAGRSRRTATGDGSRAPRSVTFCSRMWAWRVEAATLVGSSAGDLGLG